MYTVYDLLRHQARIRPDAPFLIARDAALTYGAMHARVEDLKGHLLERGLAPGDRVAVSCADPGDYVAGLLAVWGALGVVAPVEPMLPEGERATLLDVARANWMLRADGEASGGFAFEALRERDAPGWFPGDRLPAQLLFTSGSSGVPKAVMLSHEALLAAGIECADSLRLRADDVQMTTVPFWHAYGQNRGLTATLFAGASIAPVFEDDLSLRVASLRRLDPTVLLSMASFYGFLAFSKQRLGSRLRVAVAGAAPLPTPVMEKFHRLYDFPLLTTYGLTEYLLISCQRLDDPRTPGGVGFPTRGTDIRIVDDEGRSLPPGEAGRIVVRGCYAMEGYLGTPDKIMSADGWLDTEDIGTLDHTGLRILGRASAFIKRSGYKVYPAEIQNLLARHPEVVDVAVAKYMSVLGSEELAAELVLKDGAPTTADDILGYCRDNLPDYKVPSKCRIVASIPKLPSGKPDLVGIGKAAGQR